MSELISVDTLAVDSSQTTDNSINFKADLTALDTVFADGALIKFEYGTNSDLSASTHNHEDDRGLFDVGEVTSQITGLNADTQYYYKAVGETVTFNSQTSMQNAVQSKGFMSDLANSETAMTEIINSETAMTEIINSETAMTEVANSVTSRTNILASPYVIDTVWSSATASEKIWGSGTPTPPHSYNNDFSSSLVTSPTGNGEALKIEGINPDNSGTRFWELLIDVTGFNSLTINTNWSTSDNGSNMKYQIDINSNVLFSADANNTFGWTERTFDVSSYTGEVTLSMGINFTSSSYNGTFTAQFADIQLS